MVKEGDSAPDIELSTDDGQRLRLASLKGRPLVLYFYPRDDTPGCTSEAKDFTCLIGDFKKAGARVIGISPDSAKSHTKFREKFELAVELASDEDKSIAKAFGSWVEKSMYGKKYMGVQRATFLIDAEGKIARVFPKVSPKTHDEVVLEALAELQAA